MLKNNEKKVYNAIVEFINKNKYSPTVRELCKITNMSSTAAVHCHLRNLKLKGYITFVENLNRTIVVLKEYCEDEEFNN